MLISSAYSQQVRIDPDSSIHCISLEALGAGGYWSMNYEYIDFSDAVKSVFRIGVSMAPISYDENMIAVPIGILWLSGDKHNFEIGVNLSTLISME